MADFVELGFEGLNAGVDAIPDKHLDKIPGFRPPKDKREQQKQQREYEKQQRKEQRRGSRRYDDNNGQDDYDYNRRSSTRDFDGNRDSRDSPVQYPQQPTQSAQYPEQYRSPPPGGNYVYEQRPPSPIRPLSSQPRQSSRYDRNAYVPSPSRGAAASPEQSRDIGDSNKQLTPRTEPAVMDSQPYFPPPPPGEYRRYNPADYQPSRQYDDDYDRRDSYAQSGSGRRDRYEEDYDDDRREPRERRSRSKKDERNRSGLRGEAAGIKGKVQENLDTTERGLTSAALGAAAGGVIAHHFGKGAIATAAGALIGGVGANAWEARDHRHHERRAEREDAHRRRAKSQDYGNAARRGQLDYDRERRDSRDSRRDDEYYYSQKAVAAPTRGSDYDSRAYDRGGDSDEDSYTQRRRGSRRERD
ncbi:MAG: hypothetical protein M1828_004514 [Chrysothrix sp. TS-e1954]|nr:MAG: hypothetical protein M1828_004514 [Chrysothrix sp. TS-e1954]